MDLWGLDINLASDATEAQKKEYQEAVDYLNESDSGSSLIKELERSGEVIVVQFRDNDDDRYYRDTNTVTWDPGSGLVTGSGGIQTAALGLAHEFGHALQDIKGELTGKNSAQIEAENLEQVESPIAQQLGEPQRESYSDAIGVVRTEGSVSIKIVVPGQKSIPSDGNIYRYGIEEIYDKGN